MTVGLAHVLAYAAPQQLSGVENRVRKSIGFAVIGALTCALVVWLLLPGGSTTRPPHYPLAELLATPPAGSPPASPADPVVASALSQVSVSHTDAQLSAQGVSLTVDGTNIPLGETAGKTVSFLSNNVITAASNAINDGLDESTAVSEVTSSPISLQQAVAFETLSQMLYDNASVQGQVVSTQAAQAYGQQNYNEYLKDYENPSPHTQALPAPNQDQFLSADAIQQYQFSMTVTQQMEQVAGPESSSTTRTPTLESWMEGQLSAHQVQVTGVPGLNSSNVASFLPGML